MNALTFSEALAALLAGARLARAEEPQPVPLDDPTRDPDWCWTHGMKYPACQQQHEEQK